MTKSKNYCDRCGKEIEYPITVHVRAYLTQNDERIDLCQPCINSLEQWFEDKEHKS